MDFLSRMFQKCGLVCFFLILLTACSGARLKENVISFQGKNEEHISKLMLSQPKIVIDAGHGGQDLGAESKTRPTQKEKVLNLQTALMLSSFLQKMGYQTILTRGDDYFIPLNLRAQFANSNQATTFVSVHFNAAANTKAEGVEVYYYDCEKNKERAKSSKRLAKKVLDRIVSTTECKNRGVKHGNFAVIRETKMPAILVEGGFVTNPKELAKLCSSQYLKTLAGSIALGIHDFLQEGG